MDRVPGAPAGSASLDWVRRLAAPMQRARLACRLFALGLLLTALYNLQSSGLPGALLAALRGRTAAAALHADTLINALLALAGALSAWFLARAASAMLRAHREGTVEAARAGCEQLARYFIASALSSGLALLLTVAAVISALGQLAHGLAGAGL